MRSGERAAKDGKSPDSEDFERDVGFSGVLAYLCAPLQGKFNFSSNYLIINMFAIVSIAGQQFKVEEGQQIFVHRLAANEGDSVTFDTVHLVDNDGKVSIGTPNLKGAKISASVIGHVKGDKVIVFHKKRRKGYRKKNGHRQSFTKIEIKGISL